MNVRRTAKIGEVGTQGDAPASEIHFYRASDKPYGVFSNLYPRPIVFEDREFPTAEHAYQAGKARREDVRKWILSAPTPALVAMAAHGLYTWDIVSDWSEIKFRRMRAVLRAKFSQHDDFRRILLSTGDARLVETARNANRVSRTWGEVNGKGRNMLGVLLMDVREELRATEDSRTADPGLSVKKPPLEVDRAHPVELSRGARKAERRRE